MTMQCSVYITRKATLPVELERGPEVKNPIVQDQEIEEFEGLGEKMKLMLEVQNEMFSKAGSNIQLAQERYKKDYDKKRKLDKVCACCSLLRSNFMLFIT